MSRAIVAVPLLWFALSVAPAAAQTPQPPSSPIGTNPGFVADNFGNPFLAGPDNAEIGLGGFMDPQPAIFEDGEARGFSQGPYLVDPDASEEGNFAPRLFRHDYPFTVDAAQTLQTVIGFDDLSNSNPPPDATIDPFPDGARVFIDILQLSAGLFEEGTLISGIVVDPPGGTGAFFTADVVPGREYILRVAGVINGYSGISAEGGVEGWQGRYQGNISVVPLPGAALLFLSALGGLFVVRRYRQGEAAA